jgi:DNA mismatch endonuclease (patch repair protein)
MDVFTKKRRSEIMSRIGGKNTEPEASVARMLRRLGIKFSRHNESLPGTPDFVLHRQRTVLFVHGCFWHGHSCKRAKRPSTNKAFWNRKIAGNIRRDHNIGNRLRKLGWRVCTIWQCRLNKPKAVEARLKRIAEMYAGSAANTN